MFVEVEIFDGEYKKVFIRSTRIATVVENPEGGSIIIVSGTLDDKELYEIQNENSVYDIMRQLEKEES